MDLWRCFSEREDGQDISGIIIACLRNTKEISFIFVRLFFQDCSHEEQSTKLF